ncbi:MAG: IMPACT family protein [bacterium]
MVKKSRFIGLSTYVDSEAKAMDFVNKIRIDFPNATHICYAYSIGLGDKKVLRCNDAGEPTNSAGKPILTVIESSKFENIICVVVRYFGGTKLGIGGLIRAYSLTAKESINNAKSMVYIYLTDVYIKMPHEYIGAIINLTSRLKGKIINIKHDLMAEAIISIRNSLVSEFVKNVKAISKDILIEFS